jgi:hypothetical protein
MPALARTAGVSDRRVRLTPAASAWEQGVADDRDVKADAHRWAATREAEQAVSMATHGP